jgi:transposase
MKNLKSIDVSACIASAKEHLASDSSLSQSTKSLVSLLIVIIELLTSRFGANSKNSSVPPSQDPNGEKKKRVSSGRKPGGQLGRTGSTLSQVEEPDEIVDVKIDPTSLPEDRVFKELAPEKRQVFDIKMSAHVTEYRVQVLKDDRGLVYKAECAFGGAVQYGASVRGLACYLSNFQLVPIERITDFFEHQVDLPLSAGTVVNINTEAAAALVGFESLAKKELISEPVLHADETGINIAGKGAWLHGATSSSWSLFCASTKRGTDAIETMGIIPNFKGVLVHDHWASYFKYDCTHAMCCAHLVRELTRLVEESGHTWASSMIEHLYAMKKEVESVPQRKLTEDRVAALIFKFDEIIATGEIDSPLAAEVESPKRGRKKQSRARNLLDRLREKKSATLRFMTHGDAPFTNNQAERDIRMTKVHQKISGCYKTLETANASCLIRSFISTCQKQGICVSSALTDLFQGKLPNFKQTSTPTL